MITTNLTVNYSKLLHQQYLLLIATCIHTHVHIQVFIQDLGETIDHMKHTAPRGGKEGRREAGVGNI